MKEKSLNTNYLLMYAFNTKQTKTYVGYYDGVEFHSDYYSIEQIKAFDYIQVCQTDGSMLNHIPKRHNKNILKSIEMAYVRTFGEQTSLF